ncbi:MAG: sigma-70 family RNA polymerase sigma factor [Phycisphaerae bacterium]|nr:sigma-70 family RNA polymerase sigma factor [Phycisphaerae bacterium]
MEFTTTHWSVVLTAADPVAPDRRGAMAHLCETYWYPLYAYVRRRGNSAHEAEELTQEFFARLIEKEFIRNTDPEKGRFRAFLLVCLKRFLANEWDRARAEKRGGKTSIFSIDFHDADERYRREPIDGLTAERVFERRWALGLLERVLAQLADEMADSGKGRVFEKLKGYLMSEADTPTHECAARELGLSPGAVKVRVHRLRQRYRQLLRERIAMTLSDPGEVDDEIRRLFSALSV